MKRTPQPALTQFNLTLMLSVQQSAGTAFGEAGVASAAIPIDTSGSQPPAEIPPGAQLTGVEVAASAQTPLTTDFLLKTLQMNTEHIIKSLTININDLARKVEGNATIIVEQGRALKENERMIGKHSEDLARVNARLDALETGGPTPCQVPISMAVLSLDYLIDDTSTRVSSTMAKTDLATSVQEEDDLNRKRFSVKLVPGPRERLARPLTMTGLPNRNGRPPAAPASSSSLISRSAAPGLVSSRPAVVGGCLRLADLTN